MYYLNIIIFTTFVVLVQNKSIDYRKKYVVDDESTRPPVPQHENFLSSEKLFTDSSILEEFHAIINEKLTNSGISKNEEDLSNPSHPETAIEIDNLTSENEEENEEYKSRNKRQTDTANTDANTNTKPVDSSIPENTDKTENINPTSDNNAATNNAGTTDGITTPPAVTAAPTDTTTKDPCSDCGTKPITVTDEQCDQFFEGCDMYISWRSPDSKPGEFSRQALGLLRPPANQTYGVVKQSYVRFVTRPGDCGHELNTFETGCLDFNFYIDSGACMGFKVLKKGFHFTGRPGGSKYDMAFCATLPSYGHPRKIQLATRKRAEEMIKTFLRCSNKYNFISYNN